MKKTTQKITQMSAFTKKKTLIKKKQQFNANSKNVITSINPHTHVAVEAVTREGHSLKIHPWWSEIFPLLGPTCSCDYTSQITLH